MKIAGYGQGGLKVPMYPDRANSMKFERKEAKNSE